MRNKYTFSEFLSNVYSLIVTKLFYKGARLIRRPIYIRGKSSLRFERGLTTGHGCRFDLPGNGEPTLLIGKNCEMGDGVHIVAHEKVIIGDNCLMASKIFISDTNHGEYSGAAQSSPETPPNRRALNTSPVKIGNNVWIGENVVILLGIEIGDGCIIGSNSVVKKSIPQNCIAAGIPAKIIKTYCEEEKSWIKVNNNES